MLFLTVGSVAWHLPVRSEVIGHVLIVRLLRVSLLMDNGMAPTCQICRDVLYVEKKIIQGL